MRQEYTVLSCTGVAFRQVVRGENHDSSHAMSFLNPEWHAHPFTAQIAVRAGLYPRPAVQNWEERLGVVAWQRSIAPNKTVRVTVSYTVGYPREETVVGLP